MMTSFAYEHYVHSKVKIDLYLMSHEMIRIIPLLVEYRQDWW